MKNENIIYAGKGTAAEKAEIVANYNPAYPEAKVFLSEVFLFAKRHGDNLIIKDSKNTIMIDMFVELGTFSGSLKAQFVNILNMASTVIFFPIDNKKSPYAFKISLHYSK